MRLLDLVAQETSPFIVERGVPPQVWHLRGAHAFRATLAACPSRYVLDDEMAEACAELAYQTGERLVDCLDLVRFPSASMWVEWNDASAIRGSGGLFSSTPNPPEFERKLTGVMVSASEDGNRARVSALWQDVGGVSACPMDAFLQLSSRDGALSGDTDRAEPWIRVSDRDPAIATLLRPARFRLDPTWAAYYAHAVQSEDQWRQVIRASLAGIARDIPVLLAFLLLLASRGAVSTRPVKWDVLNRKRAALGKPPLLNHVEAFLAVGAAKVTAPGSGPSVTARRARPRLHRVRGHLVRRGNKLYWRRAHTRGDRTLGQVLSRTITLTFRDDTAVARSSGTDSEQAR